MKIMNTIGVALMATAITAHVSAANLIKNHSFEESNAVYATNAQTQDSVIGIIKYANGTWGSFEGLTVTNWIASHPGNTYYGTDQHGATAVFPDGDFAVRLSTQASGQDRSISQTNIQLVANQKYDFSMAAWASSNEGDAQINVTLTSPTVTVFTLSQVLTKLDGGVKTLATNFTAVATGAYTLKIYAPWKSGAGPKPWIDNVVLAPIPPQGTIILVH